MTLSKLQSNIDDKKWYESENKKKDLCGTYDFCAYCDKSKENPCANACELMNSKEVEVELAKRKYVTLSFEEKLDRAKDKTKEEYVSLITLLDEYDVKHKMFKRFVVLRLNKKPFGKVSINKNSLKIHLAIDPNKYEDIKHFDFSEKKTYQEIPFTIKLNTKKALKNVEKILKDLSK